MSKLVTLPRRHWGDFTDVTALSDEQRARRGLATMDSIIEVVGQDHLVKEAFEYALEKGLVGMDGETGGFNAFKDELSLVQVGDAERQYLIWYQTVDPEYIDRIWWDERICKVGVNLKFDIRFQYAQQGFRGIRRPVKNVADALLIEQVLNCGLMGETGQTLKESGMGPMAKRWLGLELPKDEATRTGWHLMEPGNWERFRDGTPIPDGRKKKLYAADDIPIPLALVKKQKPWIKKLGLKATIAMEHRFLPVLAEIEHRGIKIDRDQWQALSDEAIEKLRIAQDKLDELFDVTRSIKIDRDGHGVVTRDRNFNSTEQLKDLVNEYMWDHHKVDVIFTNAHFERALRRNEKLNPARLDRLFQKRMEPDPEKPGKKKKVAYPKMSDVVENFWDLYSRYLPKGAFRLQKLDKDTLKLYRVVFETPDDEVDPEFPTTVGLPPTLVDPLLERSDASKKVGTYGTNWFERMDETTGRVHASFLQAALATGRLSTQPNIQNLPRDERYRKAFVAAPGYIFVGRDWSSIEPRVQAQVSQDPFLMRVFWSECPGTAGYRKWCKDRPDGTLGLYTELGKTLGLVPKHLNEDNVKSDKKGAEGRQQSKVAELSLGYGTGDAKFFRAMVRELGKMLPFEYTSHLRRAYWDAKPLAKEAFDGFSALANPEISSRKVWHPYLEKEVCWAETIGGRKRFFSPTNEGWWTQSRNMPIQGTAGGDILKVATILINEWAWENNLDIWVVNLIHDEFILECAEGLEDFAYEKLGQIMIDVAQHYCPDVPISSSGYKAHYWVKD